ncbi:phosphohistidine phosphatase SixA [Vibrio sp. SS-MA-C1-2]|nr:phosphohistidine phosphatase SixA [Vibrio sp. SS-MA-C1-2]UJF20172.1 phosphohistidine phosphatase SixA [Vibrio sp. SS-MA-C1-2]
MKVFIMRHGEAQAFAASDSQRPLTARGENESAQMAKWLSSHFPDVDAVWVSPYLRAQQTWKAVSQNITALQSVETIEDITPHGHESDVASFIQATAAVKPLKSLLIISHLPLVGYLSAELVPGLMPPMFATSSIVGIDYDIESAAGTLLWHYAPHDLSKS